MIICSVLVTIDAVATIRNPFYPMEWRTFRVYVPLSLLGGIIFSAVFHITGKIILLNDSSSQTEQFDKLLIIRDNFIAVSYSMALVVMLGCNIYSFIMLRKPGVNKQVRLNFLKRHLGYSFVSIAVNTGVLILYIFSKVDVSHDVRELAIIGALYSGQSLMHFCIFSLSSLKAFFRRCSCKPSEKEIAQIEGY